MLDEENAALDPSNKRPITFEMLKNKGLTPRRKKENRNPRVKHRNKYKKALIRRKGQVIVLFFLIYYQTYRTSAYITLNRSMSFT